MVHMMSTGHSNASYVDTNDRTHFAQQSVKAEAANNSENKVNNYWTLPGRGSTTMEAWYNVSPIRASRVDRIPDTTYLPTTPIIEL